MGNRKTKLKNNSKIDQRKFILPPPDFVKPSDQQQFVDRVIDKPVFVGRYGYLAANDGDLSFARGDRLAVVDSRDPDWWQVTNCLTGQSGFVPADYLVADAIEAEDWFYGRINRRAAEKLLLYGDYPAGTFLIRLSERNNSNELKSYALSILSIDPPTSRSVKHYQIISLPDGAVAISNRRFEHLLSLVAFYTQQPAGLCHQLTQPCPKPKPGVVPAGRSDEIDRKDLRLIRRLGSGNFGTVYYGTFLGQVEVAVKRLKAGTMSPQSFLKEATVMRRCRHDKLVKLYGVCTNGPPLLIVTEFLSRGALVDYLRDENSGRRLSVVDLVDMCAQIASGMSYLESIRLVHRDLAARNILVGQHNQVKVADFGLARVIGDEEYVARAGAKFPIKWTAPEAALYGKFSVKSDVWSYGVLLYEVITYGGVPYPGMQNRDVLIQVSDHDYRMPKPLDIDCPDEYYEAMLKCWSSAPDRRPTFEYLFDFFENFFISTEQQYHVAEDDGDSKSPSRQTTVAFQTNDGQENEQN